MNNICKTKEATEKDNYYRAFLEGRENLSQCVIFELINTSKHREMLKNRPHRDFLDLSIVYRMVHGMTGTGIYTSPIRNDAADLLCVTEQQLFEYAWHNTKKAVPPKVTTLFDTIISIANLDASPDIANLDAFPKNPEIEHRMWVISNEKGLYGASSILYSDLLAELAEKTAADLYLLPSSIHEWIVVPSDFGVSASDFSSMVQEVNASSVAAHEQLSDHPYYYSRETGKITVA